MRRAFWIWWAVGSAVLVAAGVTSMAIGLPYYDAAATREVFLGYLAILVGGGQLLLALIMLGYGP